VVARRSGGAPRTGATALIAIDWGTTTVRAYRLDARGDTIAEHAAAFGVQTIESGRFREALAVLLGGAIPEATPLIACGMVGSRQGWVEAAYVECPADFAAVASRLKQVPGLPLAIVPGLICLSTRGVPDVMRGEETQIFGALDEAAERQLVVLPGTHSKWALVDRRGIASFATFMTGEIYAVLREHSILGRLASASKLADDSAFERGVTASLDPSAALSHDLFSARTLALTGELAPESVADYLSGLLLGAEVAAAREWSERENARGLAVTLVGDAVLCERYRRALSIAGLAARYGPGDAAPRGLWRVARQAGMLR
jgi:2-dehydro-3-deoxygalactonokinase